jgi:hypothetical protein
MFGRLADAALVHLHTIARGQDHVDQTDLTEFFKFFPWLIAESALSAGCQRLPQHRPENTPGRVRPRDARGDAIPVGSGKSELCTRKAASASVSCT